MDRHTIADAVLLPMSQVPETGDPVGLMEHIRTRCWPSPICCRVSTMEELIDLVCSGFAAVLVDGVPYAVLGGFQNFKIRGVDEPSSEMTARGSGGVYRGDPHQYQYDPPADENAGDDL